jgi:outer membrane protein, heavy metal efflux system
MNGVTRRWIAIGVVLVAVGRLPSDAAAQTTGSAIEALVARALAEAPALEAARAQVRVAEGQRQQAALRPNPIAAVDRRERFGGLDNQTVIGLTVPLDLFRKDVRVALADERVTRSNWMVEEASLTRAQEVRGHAAAVLAARRQLDVATRIAQVARSRFELLVARAESGAGRPLDRDLADVEWRRADVERVQWAAQVTMAEAELQAVVGSVLDAGRALPLSLEEEVALTAVAVSPGGGVDGRPDLRALMAEEAMAEAARELAVSEGRWNLAVSAAYMRRTVSMAGGREGMNEAMVGVMVDLPWRNRRQGEVAAAEATRQSVAADLAQRRLDATAEVDVARAREHSAAEIVARYQDGWVALAQRNLDVVSEAWTLGEATLFDVIDEERRFLALQADYTMAMRELIDARAELRRVLGVR